MSVEGVTYLIAGGASGVPFQDLTLTPPNQFGFTKWKGVVLSNYSGGIGQVVGTDDEPTNTPALTPFTSDYYDFTNARGALQIHWLASGLTPVGGAAIVATYSDDPDHDFGGKVFPASLPVGSLAVEPSNAPTLAGSIVSSRAAGATLLTLFMGTVAAGLAIVVEVYTFGTIDSVSSTDGTFTEVGSEQDGLSTWALATTSASGNYEVDITTGNPDDILAVGYLIQNAGAITAGPTQGETGQPVGIATIQVPAEGMAITSAGVQTITANSVDYTDPTLFTCKDLSVPSKQSLYSGCLTNAGNATAAFGQWRNSTPAGPFTNSTDSITHVVYVGAAT